MYSLRYYTYKRSKKHANIGKIILYTHKTGGKTGRTCNTEGSQVGGIGEIAGRDLHCTRNGFTGDIRVPSLTHTHHVGQLRSLPGTILRSLPAYNVAITTQVPNFTVIKYT